MSERKLLREKAEKENIMKQFKRILAVSGLVCCLMGVTACSGNRTGNTGTTNGTESNAQKESGVQTESTRQTESTGQAESSTGTQDDTETNRITENDNVNDTENSTRRTDGDDGVLDDAGNAVRDAGDAVGDAIDDVVDDGNGTQRTNEMNNR